MIIHNCSFIQFVYHCLYPLGFVFQFADLVVLSVYLPCLPLLRLYFILQLLYSGVQLFLAGWLGHCLAREGFQLVLLLLDPALELDTMLLLVGQLLLDSLHDELLFLGDLVYGRERGVLLVPILVEELVDHLGDLLSVEI